MDEKWRSEIAGEEGLSSPLPGNRVWVVLSLSFFFEKASSEIIAHSLGRTI